MRLTSKTEYALLALIHLGRNSEDIPLSVESIAESRGVPSRFLEQILLALRRAGFVRSVKGQRGGFLLAKEPKQIPLAEIIRLFDGALAPTESVSKHFYSETPIEREKKMLKVFKDIRDFIAVKLEQTTLADVI